MASVAQTPQARTARRSNGAIIKFGIGGAVILSVLVFVLFSSFQTNTVYYYTVEELTQQRDRLTGQNIRVNGLLDKSSIRLDQKNLVLEFSLVENGIVLPVVYRGVIPDTLSSGESVVAEGRLDPSGVFRADSILVKCPSKYEPSEP